VQTSEVFYQSKTAALFPALRRCRNAFEAQKNLGGLESSDLWAITKLLHLDKSSHMPYHGLDRLSCSHRFTVGRSGTKNDLIAARQAIRSWRVFFWHGGS
jgi:hypothetical protein